MDYLEILSAFAARFKTTVSAGESPLRPTIQFVPPPELVGRDGRLALGEVTREVTNVELPMVVDLAFAGKAVRSPTTDLPADPATEVPIGGMPIVPQLVIGTVLDATLPPEELMVSDPEMADGPGVPEILGRVKGTVTQTLQQVEDVVTRHPVGIAVRWRVVDESTPGAATPAANVRYLDGETWKELPDPLVVPASGDPAPLEAPASGDPEPITQLNLELELPALFSELTTGTPDVMTLSIRAAIKLNVTPEDVDPVETPSWIDLPPIPFVLPTIPVPTILVLCEHRDFVGRKVVLVPSNSAIGTVDGGVPIERALELTASALGSLAPNHDLLRFLSGELSAPAGAVLKAVTPAYKQVIVAAHSRVDNLATDEFLIDPGWWGFGRLTGEDMASSIICVGRPGTVFDLFDWRDLVEHITRLRITLDDNLGCAIRSLEQNDPTPDVTYGGDVMSFSINTHHEDKISSLNVAGPADRFLPV